jgi:hypothetical protein
MRSLGIAAVLALLATPAALAQLGARHMIRVTYGRSHESQRTVGTPT